MIDRTGYAALLVRQPYLYHLVGDINDDKLGSVLEHGLDRTASHYGGMFVSRPGHAYMGSLRTVLRGDALRGLRERGPYALLRIEVGKLEPHRINPDEDHFMTGYWVENSVNCVDGKHACRRFHLPFPPTTWIWEWAEYLKRPIPTLGEWAEGVKLGADPAETRYSLAKGSLAYGGVIPPDALRLVQRT